MNDHMTDQILNDGTYASGELSPLYGDMAGTQIPILAATEDRPQEWRDTGWWADYGGHHANPSIWQRSDEGQAARHVVDEKHFPSTVNMLPVALAAALGIWFIKR